MRVLDREEAEEIVGNLIQKLIDYDPSNGKLKIHINGEDSPIPASVQLTINNVGEKQTSIHIGYSTNKDFVLKGCTYHISMHSPKGYTGFLGISAVDFHVLIEAARNTKERIIQHNIIDLKNINFDEN